MSQDSSAAPRAAEARQMAKAVYILYLVGLIFVPTLPVGVIIAYAWQGRAPDWVRDHFRLQIRTFWLGLLFLLAGIVASVPRFMLFPPALLVHLAWLAWLIARCARGLQQLAQDRPPPDPATWLW